MREYPLFSDTKFYSEFSNVQNINLYACIIYFIQYYTIYDITIIVLYKTLTY